MLQKMGGLKNISATKPEKADFQEAPLN